MLPWFAERHTGWAIRIGPNAHKRPDPYIWRVMISDDGKWLIDRDGALLIPLSDSGEFGPVSTAPLNSEAVRTAISAARALGFDTAHWLHNGEITMAHKKSKHDRKPGRTMPHTDEAVHQSGALDLAAVKAAIPDVVASFEKGEYQALGHSIADLGNGYEAYVMLRKKAAG